LVSPNPQDIATRTTMIKMLEKKVTVLAILIFISPIVSFSQNYEDTLQIKIEQFYNQKNLPGFAVAIVNEQGVIFQESNGYADLKSKKPYTLETIQLIASTTKTTIAFAVMKLLEEGKLSLESPINEYLPYNIYNPHYPDSIITLEHLVTHTSGIVDTENNYDLRGRYFIKQTSLSESKLDKETLEYIKNYEQNKRISLKRYCKNVFHIKGKWHSNNTFLKNPPGSYYQYSNLGATLTAHIVERASGKCFDDFVEQILFKDLNLEKSTFNIKNVDTDLLAKSHVDEEHIVTPFFGENTYPDGGLFTNCKELSVYLIEMIKGYNGQSKLLTNASFKTMMNSSLSEKVVVAKGSGRNFQNIGVFWQRGKDGGIMHNGGNALGGTVYMSFNPKTNIGRILMTNCDVRASRDMMISFISIWRTMDKYAEYIN